MSNDSSKPLHIGFIMDGNGRWATRQGLPRTVGHKAGADAFKKVIKYCRKIGIKYVSFYAFSTENWKRPKEEVDAIMSLFDDFLNQIENYKSEDARVIFLGDKSVFSDAKRNRMIEIEENSENKTGITLLLAINYGGRDEIVHAAKQISQKVSDGEISIDDVDEKMFGDYLYSKGVPDVDLLVRPGGELRISNFLIWQCAYAEFYFSDVLWPEFNEEEIDKALQEFSSRKRRFGGVV